MEPRQTPLAFYRLTEMCAQAEHSRLPFRLDALTCRYHEHHQTWDVAGLALPGKKKIEFCLSLQKTLALATLYEHFSAAPVLSPEFRACMPLIEECAENMAGGIFSDLLRPELQPLLEGLPVTVTQETEGKLRLDYSGPEDPADATDWLIDNLLSGSLSPRDEQVLTRLRQIAEDRRHPQALRLVAAVWLAATG